MPTETKKKMVTVYRDPNCKTATMQYRNGPIRYKFHVNKTEFEVEEGHVIFVVRDCADLFRTKPTGREARIESAKTEKTKSEGE